MRLDTETVRSTAQGRWQSFILPSLGVEVPNNPRKHGPCPTCGGRDRFRFDDIDGRGSWFCNQCTPQAGDGFRLLMNVRGCDFPEALQIVAGVLGLDSTTRVTTPRPLPAPPIRINRKPLAFKYDLAALDLRLRAGRIIEAGKQLNADVLGDVELDRALALMAHAHADGERAELFAHVADVLRVRDFSERILHHARPAHAA